MNLIIQVCGEHPFWFCVALYIILKSIWLIIRMPFRCFNIAIRGWPNAPIDADGDVVWKEKEEKDEVAQ